MGRRPTYARPRLRKGPPHRSVIRRTEPRLNPNRLRQNSGRIQAGDKSMPHIVRALSSVQSVANHAGDRVNEVAHDLVMVGGRGTSTRNGPLPPVIGFRDASADAVQGEGLP